MHTDAKTASVIASATIYAAALMFFSFANHAGLRSQMNDLGNMDQAVWQASQGHLSMPISNPSSVRSRLSVHTNFIFWLIAPLYWIWPNVRLLLALNSLACAATGLGLYAVARRRLGNSIWCLAPPFAFWLSPVVQDANLYDFHAVTLASAFVVWMISAFDSGRVRAGWLLFGLALSCEEKICFLLIAYGVGLLFDPSQKHRGQLMIAISAVYFTIAVSILVPLFNHGRPFKGPQASRYGWLTVTSFPDIIGHLVRPDRLRLPAFFLAAGAAVAFEAWPLLLMLVPSILEGMLSNTTWTTRITGSYYWIIPTWVIILACIQAAGPLSDGKRRTFPLFYLLTVTALLSVFLSPLPYGVWASRKDFQAVASASRLAEIARSIPQQAGLCVQNNLGSHLSHRERIYQVTMCPEDADFALFHLEWVASPFNGREIKNHPLEIYQSSPADLVRLISQFVTSGKWRLVLQDQRYYLFEKIRTPMLESTTVPASLANDAEVFLASPFEEASPKVLVLLNNKVSWKEFK
jgi:uncharacterized membrane protein